MARDIADLDTRWRSALYKIVRSDAGLRQTTLIPRQWDDFFLPLAKSLSTTIPIVVVIDALDESGDVQSRAPLLERLASAIGSGIPTCPSAFRAFIVVQQRAVGDFHEVGIVHAEQVFDCSVHDRRIWVRACEARLLVDLPVLPLMRVSGHMNKGAMERRDSGSHPQ